MGYIVGEDRAQAFLLPSRVEDYVASDAAVRVVEAFTDGLDLALLGFVRAVAEEAARLDAKIAAYLAGLDEADAAEPDDAPQAVQTALAALRDRRAELDRLAARFDEEERTTLVEGEEDARPMGIRHGPKPPSYNVQTAVDADTGLILHHEVTGEPTDRRQLHPMARRRSRASVLMR